MEKLVRENYHLNNQNEQLLCRLTAYCKLLTRNQQLTTLTLLAEVEEGMENLGAENKQLKHGLTVCSHLEALKKELQLRQNHIKELWKKLRAIQRVCVYV